MGKARDLAAVVSAAATADYVKSADAFGARITNNSDGSQGLQVRTSDNDTGQYILDLQTSSSATGTDYASKLFVEKSGKTTLTNTSAGASTTPFVLHNASSNANTDVRMLLAPCTTAADRPVILAAENNGSNVCAFTVSTPNGGTPVERFRIDGVGNVMIGTTASNYPSTTGTTISPVSLTVSRDSGSPMDLNRGQNDGQIIGFRRSSSTVGSISVSSSATAFNTSSDYRLKENVETLSGAITRVKSLKPKRFSWIVDEEDSANVDGFLAHEAQAVVPEAVTGAHNEVDDDDNPVMQGIDQSKQVPLLTAALQEAIAEIDVLKTKVAALEAD